MSAVHIAVAARQASDIPAARLLADQLGVMAITDPIDEIIHPVLDQQLEIAIILLLTDDRLECHLLGADAPGPIDVDFLGGALAHRRQYGGGRGQLIARAVGLNRKKRLSILDVTAGLGRDAFVLAQLGNSVTMVERSSVLCALLRDGLRRGQAEAWFRELSLNLVQADALDYMDSLSEDKYPEVVYLDPMYPSRKKRALVKKEMRILRALVGDDMDAAGLLARARRCARYRVVVKRPRLAECLAGVAPDLVFTGKSSRFDVYQVK